MMSPHSPVTAMTAMKQCAAQGDGERAGSGGFGDGGQARRAARRCNRPQGGDDRRCLNADVAVQDSIVVDVDFSVVVEVTVVPAARAQTDVRIDPAVVVDVQLS